MYTAWLEELYQVDWFMNIYWKNLICGSLNQWFVRDDRCSQKHLTSWGLNTVFLTIWKCYKCQLQAMFSLCCISLFRQYVLVSYSDLDKIASIHVQCGFLCPPLSTGNMLLIQIFLVFLEWGTVIRCRKPELAIWAYPFSFARGKNLLDGCWYSFHLIFWCAFLVLGFFKNRKKCKIQSVEVWDLIQKQWETDCFA